MPISNFSIPISGVKGAWGAPVDLSTVGPVRTITWGGGGPLDLVELWISPDGVLWSLAKSVEAAASSFQVYQGPWGWIRSRRIEVDGMGLPQAAICGELLGAGAVSSVVVPVPALPGVGAPVSCAAFDVRRMVFWDSADPSDVVDLEVSSDGTTYHPLTRFFGSSVGRDPSWLGFAWLWARARRVKGSGSPVLQVAVCPPSSGGGGSSPPFPLGTALTADLVSESLDAFGRRQVILTAPPNGGLQGGVFKTGQNQVDGDPGFNIGGGFTGWGRNPSLDPYDMNNWSMARLDGDDGIWLMMSKIPGPGQFNIFEVNGSRFALRDLGNGEVLTVNWATHQWTVAKNTEIKGADDPYGFGPGLVIRANSCNAGGAPGGDLSLIAGDQTLLGGGGGMGGTLYVRGGNGSPGTPGSGGRGGPVSIVAGTGGDGTIGQSGWGGDLLLSAGQAGSNGGGGGGNAGNVQISSASGSPSFGGSAARPGGTVQAFAGDGGNGAVGVASANGGLVTLKAGAAGNPGGGPGGGKGGGVSITTGDGNGGSTGDLLMNGGTPGGGTFGLCRMSNFATVTIGQTLQFTGMRIGGTLAPTHMLDMEPVAGGGYYDKVTHAWVNGSTRAIKAEIEDCKIDLLQVIRDVQIVQFKYRSEAEAAGESEAVPLHVGFIADDAPGQLVTKDRDGQAVPDCLGVLLGAVKLLLRRVELLEEKKGRAR